MFRAYYIIYFFSIYLFIIKKKNLKEISIYIIIMAMNNCVRRGRPVKYKTDEERREASKETIRKYSLAYYHKHKDEIIPNRKHYLLTARKIKSYKDYYPELKEDLESFLYDKNYTIDEKFEMTKALVKKAKEQKKMEREKNGLISKYKKIKQTLQENYSIDIVV